MPALLNIVSKRAIKMITLLAASSTCRRTLCTVFQASSLPPRTHFNIAFCCERINDE
jgi:hypothetical protein